MRSHRRSSSSTVSTGRTSGGNWTRGSRPGGFELRGAGPGAGMGSCDVGRCPIHGAARRAMEGRPRLGALRSLLPQRTSQSAKRQDREPTTVRRPARSSSRRSSSSSIRRSSRRSRRRRSARCSAGWISPAGSPVLRGAERSGGGSAGSSCRRPRGSLRWIRARILPASTRSTRARDRSPIVQSRIKPPKAALVERSRRR